MVIGVIYCWFGFLKFFPTLSPAEGLASDTISELSFGLIPADLGRISLAILEVIIGLGLILRFKLTWFVRLAMAHMCFTFTPLFLFPELAFSEAPYGFTMLGQYIMKNLVILFSLYLLLPSRKSEVSSVLN